MYLNFYNNYPFNDKNNENKILSVNYSIWYRRTVLIFISGYLKLSPDFNGIFRFFLGILNGY